MRWLPVTLLLGVCATPAFGQSGELVVTSRVFHRVIPEDLLFAQLRLPALTTTTAAARSALQLHVLGELRGRPVDALGLRAGLDTGLLEIDLASGGLSADGRDLGTRFKETLFLGQTSLDLELGEQGVVQIRAGKLRPRIGAGAVYDAYAFGLSADADLAFLDEPKPVWLTAAAYLPDDTFTARSKNSPLLHLALGVRLGEHVSLSAFGALFLDGGDALAPVLADTFARGLSASAPEAVERVVESVPPALQPTARRLAEASVQRAQALYNAGAIGFDVSTEGRLLYGGLEARARGEDWSLGAALVLESGRVDTRVAPNEGYLTFIHNGLGRFPNVEQRVIDSLTSDGPIDLSGSFLRLDGRLEIVDGLSADSFLMYMSGDGGTSRKQGASDQRYSAFVGLAPLIADTSIFFNGGLATSLASPTSASPAPDGAGLYGGGLALGYEHEGWARARLLAASFWSPIGNANDARWYGLELDLNADVALADRWLLFVDGGLFSPGPYYGGERPLGVQLIVGAQVAL